MVKRKYTLPRHTNLARQSSRTGAFLVDLAIFVAVAAALVFGCLQFIFKAPLKPLEAELKTEQINSHLRYEDEKGNAVEAPEDAGFDYFCDAISYYYMNYITGDVEVPGTGSRTADEKLKLKDGSEVNKKDFFTVEWFNKNVLGIGEDPDNDGKCLFTYKKDGGGNYILTEIGVPKDASKVKETDVQSFMIKTYMDTYDYDFLALSYIEDLNTKINFFYTLEWVIATLVSAGLCYIMMPFILKNGQTVGKKVFRLGLANMNGYKIANSQLIMRIIPLTVVILAMLIPIWTNLFYVLTVHLTIFLVSFALAMASPKRMSLHDFTARTIVVDLATSTLFASETEEIAYINKEDNIEADTSAE